MSVGINGAVRMAALFLGLTLYGFGITLGTQSGRQAEGSASMVVIGAILITATVTL